MLTWPYQVPGIENPKQIKPSTSAEVSWPSPSRSSKCSSCVGRGLTGYSPVWQHYWSKGSGRLQVCDRGTGDMGPAVGVGVGRDPLICPLTFSFLFASPLPIADCLTSSPHPLQTLLGCGQLAGKEQSLMLSREDGVTGTQTGVGTLTCPGWSWWKNRVAALMSALQQEQCRGELGLAMLRLVESKGL